MGNYHKTIDSMVSLQPAIVAASKHVVHLLEAGSVELIVQPYDEKVAEKRRNNAQNRLVYAIYQRIAKTLHGNDETHTRRECKLKIGCRILRRDNDEFASTYDRVIRPLDYETKLKAMDLVSVSSIMSIKQAREYITRIIDTYSQEGVYFSDIDGTEEYLKQLEGK